MKNTKTEKKQPKNEFLSFKQAEELFYLNSIVKNLPGSVYWKDKDGVYLGCNDYMLQIVGMTSVVGKTDFDMPWREQAQQLRKNDLNVMQLKSTLEIEEDATLANGQHITALTRKTPLKDRKGNVVGIIGVSLNITERKIYESCLKDLSEQTESTLENIVANMPGHVYWKDRNGVYLGCNIRQANSLGFRSPEDIIGKTDFDLPWNKDIAALYQKNDFRIMDSGKAEIIEEESQREGKKIIVLSHKTPMFNKHGDITGILGISIDITDRKQIETELKEAKERAESANETKTEFLNNMRHDIRTPLTGITGFANIISEEVKDPKIKEYVDNLSASSDALLNLLNEILEIIEINTGEIPIVEKKFNLEKRLDEIINLYKAKAKQKNIELIVQYDKKIPRYLIGDSLRIHRIVLELVANAFNFTDAGSIRLITKLAKVEGNNIIIKLIVKDSGVGIAQNKQDEIFIQFKRLIPSYKGIYKGAGLGLAIVKEFINDMQGEIYVESEDGAGSTFTCIFPLKKALLDDELGCETISPSTKSIDSTLESAATPKIKTDLVDEKNSLKSTILVVEDNLIAATVAKTILSHLSCRVELATDGKSAVQLTQYKDFDLIFMDIGLPDIDGYETTRRIRLQELNKGIHVPIIALTAHLDEENKQHCLQVGMNAVLTKPLTKDKAEELLNAFIPFRKPEPTPHEKSDSLSTTEAPFQLEGEIIDFEQLLEQVGDQRELANDMLSMLIHSFPEELALFNQAYTNQDWPAIQKLAHKMKSSASYCGTTRLKSACYFLESAIKNEQLSLYEPLYKQLLEQIGLVNIRYKNVD